MGPARAFLYILISFILGVGTRSLLPIPTVFALTVSVVAFLGMIIAFRHATARFIFLCALLFALGILRFNISEPRNDSTAIRSLNNKGTVTFMGVVVQEPDVRQDSVKLTVSVRKVQLKKRDAAYRGKVLVTAPLYPEIAYGEALLITCTFKSPEPVQDFAYDQYLSRFGVYSLCSFPRIKRVSSGQGNPIMNSILNVKRLFTNRIQMAVPEPEASFLGGLVLGAKRSIPQKLMDAFARTGTTHVVALSGYNITIIAVCIQNLCRALRIPKRKGFWVALGVIAIFILMTGAQASVVRAGIMGGLTLLANRLGRLSRITNALVLAAFCMLAINPRILAFDAGFQLSFLSTLGLVYCSPLIEKWFVKVPDVLGMRSSLVATLSAMMFTLPLIVATFGRISLIAPLVNALILPFVPLAMGVGFATGIAAFVWLPLGKLCGWLAWLVLRSILLVIETGSSLPFTSYSLSHIHWALIIACYAGIIFVLWKNKKRPRGDIVRPAV